MVAAVGSGTAASLALESGRDVIDMGGFMGSDPSPSLAQLKRLIRSGQLHYVLLADGRGAGAINGPGESSAASRVRDSWIASHGEVVKVAGQTGAGVTLYYFSSAA
jgi:hypothetical protein